MALHDSYKDYTKEELKEIIKKVCIAHNCPYMRNISNHIIQKGYKGVEYVSLNKCCMYIDIKGHQRGCMPDECTHYNDNKKEKKK